MGDPRLMTSAGAWGHGRRIWSGMHVGIDVGVTGPGGYHSDLCRCWYVGDAPDEATKGYYKLIDAYLTGVDRVRPGMKVSDVHRIINQEQTERGMDITRCPMGHGIGLRIAESPLINAPDMLEYDKTLREGMTICIEPESTMEVKGVECYIKVEDVWVVEANGLRRISPVGWDYCGH